MAGRVLRYRVGNEHSPVDPWGRSDLVIHSDGTARVDHHFSRVRTVAAWRGRVVRPAIDRLWFALARAGFPAEPDLPLVADEAVRVLTVEVDGDSRYAMVGQRAASSVSGYAEAFDILDGVIRQLSGDTVPYPTTQPQIVDDAVPVPVPVSPQ